MGGMGVSHPSPLRMRGAVRLVDQRLGQPGVSPARRYRPSHGRETTRASKSRLKLQKISACEELPLLPTSFPTEAWRSR
jgi:hypothetical protein